MRVAREEGMRGDIVGGGRVEEDDGAVGETGAFAEGGWCWSGQEVSGVEEGMGGYVGGTYSMRR